MGSLFLIVIPIRNYELRLRLIENDILNSVCAPISAPETGESGLRDRMRTLSNSSIDELGNTLLVKDIPLPPTKDELKAYTLNKGGGQYLLQLTRDTMKLTKTRDNNRKKAKKRASTTSINSGLLGSPSGFLGGATSLAMIDINSTDDFEMTKLIDSQFLEKHIEDVLQKFKLLHANWETSIDAQFSLITFSVSEQRADIIINHLHVLGIGKKYESILSVCATSVFTQEAHRRISADEEAEGNQGGWSNFVQSIKARLTVAQVVQNVQSNAILTFDYIVMLIVAAIIASLGLLENSPVNIIASMLVSPLMGPIMAFTFGAMIRDCSLIKTGLVTEMYGLLICLVIGLIFGIFLEARPIPGPWHNVTTWPTGEMYGRTQPSELIVGAGIAIPSGAGVALSILAGNAGSLVGVAISASLLPPCVNCGIFYGMALVIAFREVRRGKNPFGIGCFDIIGSKSDNSPWMGHEYRHCKNSLHEYAIMGSVSLCLTLINIVLIFLTGVLILKIKEVAPYTTRTAFERFWKHDIKQVRDYNIEHGTEGDSSLLKDIEGDPNLLNLVQEDFVFTQVRNRAMYRDENVLNKVMEKVNKSNTDTAVPNSGGWFSSLFGRGQSSADVEAKKSRRKTDTEKKVRRHSASYK